MPGLPYLRAEALYAARYEMARSVDDILSRRTRARLLGRDASAAAAPAVAALVAADLGWDARRAGAPGQGLPRPGRRGAPRPPTCPRPRSTRLGLTDSLTAGDRRSLGAMTTPHALPDLGPGAPTPPIALAGGAADGHRRTSTAGRVEVPDAVRRAAGRACAPRSRSTRPSAARPAATGGRSP